MGFAELNVEWSSAGAVAQITASGEADLGAIPSLRAAAAQAVATNPSELVFDLRQVTYVDCGALGVLLAAWRTLRPNGGRVTVLTAHPAVLQALRLTGVDRVLEVLSEPRPAATGAPPT
jgi:anti-sigma B factor antagonist